ncbi:XRE family transcriptional regulator [Avibacterium avium]|uniref:XRE family transcriptional regulator n=1 Tax=Avibacterium avium TaxID=751 RepID=UPI003BF7F567
MLHSKGKMLHKITINEIVLAQKLSIALRQEMHAQHWTGKMVATALEVSERTVRDWLSGNRLPNGRDLVALMTISPHIRQVIWEESQSEKYYLDTQMIRVSIDKLSNVNSPNLGITKTIHALFVK